MTDYDLIYHHLNKWCVEYDIEVCNIEPCITDRLKEFNYLGLTTFKYDTFDIRYCIIEISDVIKNEFLFTSVLWHEFCHCEPWIKDGISDGHGDKWLRRLWRKPVYAISQWIAKLVYGDIKF